MARTNHNPNSGPPPSSIAKQMPVNATHPQVLRNKAYGEKAVPTAQIKAKGSGYGPSHMLVSSDWHLHGEVVDSINAGGPLPL